VNIIPADGANQPRFNAYGNAIGGVTPGDLFTIDISGTPADTSFNLFLTNADELVHNYRYLTLHIGLYERDGSGGWVKTTSRNGEIFLTMQNGAASFTLAGGAEYRVAIESGCYFCYGVANGKSIVLPDFYMVTAS
jgi:hypothetical protein